MQLYDTTNHSQQLVTSGDRVAMVGLGATGRSCLEFLKNKNVDVIAMDTRTQPPEIEQIQKQFPEVEFQKGALHSKTLLEADLIVISPGVSMKTDEIEQASDAGVPVVGDIELFASEVKQPVISITGSNGKSTVTALCGQMLTAAGIHVEIGGNFGRPALDLLTQNTDYYVLELSSFQLETTYNLVSQAAVILNITPDHMDRYETFEDYCSAKHRVYNRAITAAYNRSDPLCKPESDSIRQKISFALDQPPSQFDFGLLKTDQQSGLCQGDRNLVTVRALPIKGRHNQLNALAALALVYLIGVDLEKAVAGLLNFKGLPHRFETVGNFNGVVWINDSKGTNPGATLASVSGQDHSIVLILGGDAKGADFSVLIPAIEAHVKAVVLFGRDSELIERVLPESIAYSKAASLSEVVQMADDFSSENDMVLFSPACASFDMFNNYMQRGDAFRDCVVEYFQ